MIADTGSSCRISSPQPYCTASWETNLRRFLRLRSNFSQGNQGILGNRGEPGREGIAGAGGDAGDIGAPGAPGPRGDNGDMGEVGAPGPLGKRGDAGAQGAPGKKKIFDQCSDFLIYSFGIFMGLGKSFNQQVLTSLGQIRELS